MAEPKSLDALSQICLCRTKSELTRRCETAVVYKSDFADFILACETGTLPWRHRIHYRDFVPSHLKPSTEERAELLRSGVGPLSGKASKMVSKLGQLFKERRYLVGHLFFTPALDNWHFFYFDQRDIAPDENHWGSGPHIHLINHLWPKHTAESLWGRFVSGNVHLSGSLYLKFIEDARNT